MFIFVSERMTGHDPAPSAWKAEMLPITPHPQGGTSKVPVFDIPMLFLRFWKDFSFACDRRDLNPWPSGPQPDALTNYATATAADAGLEPDILALKGLRPDHLDEPAIYPM